MKKDVVGKGSDYSCGKKREQRKEGGLSCYRTGRGRGGGGGQERLQRTIQRATGSKSPWKFRHLEKTDRTREGKELERNELSLLNLWSGREIRREEGIEEELLRNRHERKTCYRNEKPSLAFS